MDKIKLTRFEIFVDDEAQNVGFLVGLDDTEMSDDLKGALLYNLNKNLTVPDMSIYKNNKQARSFFKDLALNEFKEDIEKIIEEYEYDGLFSVGKIELLVDCSSFVYQDEHQVIAPIKDIDTISYSVKDVDSGTYKIKSLNTDSLFDKYELVPSNLILDESKAIKVTTNVYLNDFYYYVDFDNSLIKIVRD